MSATVAGVPKDRSSESVMVTVKLDPEAASAAVAARTLGLRPEDLDQDFGVVAIDPNEHLYAVLVGRDAAARAQAAGAADGVFSNPKVEPFE
jgi:hypothetical protein